MEVRAHNVAEHSRKTLLALQLVDLGDDILGFRALIGRNGVGDNLGGRVKKGLRAPLPIVETLIRARVGFFFVGRKDQRGNLSDSTQVLVDI